MKLQKYFSTLISILLLYSLFPGVSLAQVADEDVITLTVAEATLDLAADSEAKIAVDNGLTVNYSGALNMRLTIAVSGSGNVLDYNPDKLPVGMDVTLDYSPDSVTFEGTADPSVWQDLLRSVTLSINWNSLPIYNEQRTITFTTFANYEVTDMRTVQVLTGAGADPGGMPGGDLGGDPGGDSSYTIEEITPTITEQPVNMTVNQGEHAVLSVTASVIAGTLSYQWYSNTINSSGGWPEIAGETNPTYTVSTSNPGTTYYYVDVVNTIDTQIVTIFSDIVQVTVHAATNAEAPTITEQPMGATVNQGEDSNLSVSASVNSGTLSYQWYSNDTASNSGGTMIDVASGSSFAAPTDTAGETYYYVVITNTDNTATGNKTSTVTSNAVLMKVNEVTHAEAPSITQQPEGAIVNQGETATMSVTASVYSGNLSYQWYSNDTDSNSGGTLIDGATESSYATPTNTAGETYYYVVVANTDNTATGNKTASTASNAVLVKVNDSGPIISTIAGTGVGGYSGDGGPANLAEINNPYAVAIDSSGNVYIADTTNNRIRKIALDGTIQTIAGTGTPGYSGDGGPATNARLNNPSGIAVDSSGNVYVADRYNNRIRKIATDGTISTIAGTGSASYSGDGGPANEAAINSPTGVTVDSSGNVYIADRYNDRIRKIATDGTISTVTGTGSSGYSGDGGPADQAQLYWPFGVALDSGGNLYITDYSNHRVRKVTPDGTIQTVAGTGSSGISEDGGPADQAQLYSPSGIAIDSSGNIYIAEYGGSRIRKIASDGTISTVAGTGSSGYSGDGGPADEANVNRPLGVAVDSSGNVYIPDTFNHRIRKVTFSIVDDANHAEAPTITQQPVGATITEGETAKLSISASGTPLPTYQWRFNGTAIAGATSTTYHATSAGLYDVVVSNSQGSVSSNLVRVTVRTPEPEPAPAPAPPPAPTSVTSSPHKKVLITKETTSTETDESGKETKVTQVDEADLKNQLNQDKDAKAIVIPVDSSTGKAKAKLSVNALEQTAANNSDNTIVVQSNSAEYSLPSSLVNTGSISSSLGISEQDAANAEVNVTIEEKPDTAVTHATRGKSKLASKVVDFSITVTSGDNTVELNNFGNTYVDRAIDLTQNVNPAKAVGVIVNADGTLSPVPTEFVETDGKKVAVLKRNSNSTYAVVEYDITLNDIAVHWGQADIQLLADKLIVNGFEDGSFRPNQQVTRAEFVTLLVRALGLDVTQIKHELYTDVAADDWYAGALTAANQAGLVKGYTDGSFRGNLPITRQEASVLLGNAIDFLQLREAITEGDSRQALDTYKDADDVSSYAREAVGMASSLGLLQGGEEGMFRPQLNATRAETVVMIKNLMELAEFITY